MSTSPLSDQLPGPLSDASLPKKSTLEVSAQHDSSPDSLAQNISSHAAPSASVANSCPCQSGQSYEHCCQPYHQHKAVPKTAEQLMRSRYCAYVLGDIAYLVHTTLPIQQARLNKQAMRQWSQSTNWQGLRVIKHKPNIGANQAKVIFEAYYRDEQGLQTHYEESLFIKIQGRWYFKDPSL